MNEVEKVCEHCGHNMAIVMSYIDKGYSALDLVDMGLLTTFEAAELNRELQASARSN